MDKATAARNNEVEVEAKAQVKCTNCGEIYTIDTLDPEMRCPKCDHTGWTPVKPNTGERNQLPDSSDTQVDAH